ncbi:MAG: OmpA family protein [Alphaproteobacteria bacterium]|nr:OmpA family protein [Alphaproteobacteria bacterium]
MKLSLLFVALAALWVAMPAHAAPSALEAVQDVDAAYQAAPVAEEGASRPLFSSKAKAKKKSSKKHSKDFYDAHKSAPKKAAKGAAVQADDLMNAMRKGIDPAAQPDAPMLVPAPATTTAPVAPAVAAEQPMQAIPSEKLFHPAPKDETAQALPPVTPKAGAAAPLISPVATPAPIPATPPVAQEPKKEEVATSPTKEAPKKEEAKTGAPLLSDLNEPPDGAIPVKADEAIAPVSPAASAPAVKPTEPATPPSATSVSSIEAASEPVKESAKPEVPEGFAKPRSLFSAAGDTKKRPGITRHKTAIATPTPSSAPLEKQAEPNAALPPVAPPPAGVTQATVPASAVEKEQQKEPMIKPVGEAAPAQDPAKKSIWGAPTPDMNKGKVIFSQSADGTVTKAAPEPLSTKGEVISTEEASNEASPPPEENKSEEKDEKKSEEKPEVKSAAPADTSAEAMNEATENEAVVEAPKAPATSTVAPSEHRVTTSVHNPAAGGVVHGSCGAVNGVGLASKPTSNLCTQGTASAVTGKGPWNWSCNGSNGGSTVKCSASVQINGECGPANGSLSASPPPNKLCSSGKATSITGDGPWYWSCFGDNGGVTAQCVVYTLVSGACGPANNVATGSAPTTGLCKSGHETAVIGEGPWSWSCTGSGENTTVSCTAPVLKEGVCGQANGIGATSAPHSGLCASGNPSAVSGAGPWNWKCAGENGGASVSCSAPILLNAACGAAHGVGVAVAPAENLCMSGSASAVSGTGPWNWTCNGENGGAMADCMAPKKLDGVCGPAHQAGSSDAPTAGLCNSGTPSAVAGSGPWQWSCQGAGGGITATCVSQPLVHAGCGSAHGVSVTAPPTDNLCASGTPTTVIGSGPFMWSCQGANGGSAINCMAPLQVNGACGGADGVPVNIAPINNLCRSGTASAVSGNGPFVWTCSGSGGGISTTCQAPMITATPDPVPPPAAPAPEVHVPEATAKAGNECTPSVKRWTITCQQGGYPSNYTGVIVGETQTLCPTGVERGVWLSNSCAAATDSAPVSPSPGKLETQTPSHKVTEVLPEIAPMPAKQLDAPKKLYTPRYKQAATTATTTEDMTTITFPPTSEGLDSSAINALDGVMNELNGNDKSIVTLNAYAAPPADGDQQESRRMALARALAVRSYLMRKGLASSRIDVRAVGPASDNRGDDRVDIKVK